MNFPDKKYQIIYADPPWIDVRFDLCSAVDCLNIAILNFRKPDNK